MTLSKGDPGDVLRPFDVAHARSCAGRQSTKPFKMMQRRSSASHGAIRLGDNISSIADQHEIGQAERQSNLEGVDQGEPLRIRTGALPDIGENYRPPGSNDRNLHCPWIRAAATIEENLHRAHLGSTNAKARRGGVRMQSPRPLKRYLSA
jgi:hypothetical protein